MAVQGNESFISRGAVGAPLFHFLAQKYPGGHEFPQESHAGQRPQPAQPAIALLGARHGRARLLDWNDISNGETQPILCDQRQARAVLDDQITADASRYESGAGNPVLFQLVMP